ncbi:hypothetical protein M3Y97_00143200 [Aphelenchoides bicaudatus]|nr:hypothetical protein M3Y97_00143200 [Aphelenchoides bicaudatus]
MVNDVSLPRLRGQALSCFTKHYVGGLIQTKLRSISIRTREHRKQASSAIWKFLLSSRNLVRNYNKFIAPYSPIMGQLVYRNGSFSIERLFGRPLKLPLDSKQYEDALELYFKAIGIEEVGGNNLQWLGKVWYNISTCWSGLERADKALETVGKAIACDPSHAGYFYGRGTYYKKLGDHENAVIDFKKSLELDPTYKNEIDLSFEVAARQLNWRCPRMTSTFYSMDKFNSYVNTLCLETSTFALEWTFDLLNSINKVFPSIKAVHLRYYHVPQPSKELLPCFLQGNEENYELIEFVSNLKIDNLNATEFIGMFSKLISEQIPVDFSIDIISPAKGCNLATVRNSYAEKNLRVHFIKMSSKFDLLRK